MNAAIEVRVMKLVGYDLLVIKLPQDSDTCCAKLNIQLQPSSQFDFNERMFIEKFLIRSDKGLKKKLVNIESGETLKREFIHLFIAYESGGGSTYCRITETTYEITY